MIAFFRILLAIFFIIAGMGHFLIPGSYAAIMPPYFPAPYFLIYLSGFFEILGGIGVLVPSVRLQAGWGLILLLIAVFPANIYAFFHGMTLGTHTVPHAVLLLRLPVQVLFILWVFLVCCRTPTNNGENNSP